MPLQIIAGGSGAGKSYTVYQELIDASIAHPERTFLVIVPEQFTMQTQKDLVQMHPRHGLLNLDVLSFNRLAWRVFEEVGGNQYPVLDDLGKTLILQKVIGEQTKHLSVLGGTLKKTGSVEEMKSLISELLQYRVSPEDLADWREILPARNSLLTHKLEDVRTVYGAFMDTLKGSYVTTEEVPERLCQVLGKSAFVRNAEIVLDGFTGFTPVQLQVVRELMRLGASVRVIVTAGAGTDLARPQSPQHLFYMSSEMIRSLYQIAREDGCEILPVRRISGNEGRFGENPPLQFLEKNLFRYGSRIYENEQDRIRILVGRDPREEIAFAAGEISRLVREEGYRYRDFAIITGDLEHYGREAARQLASSGIPHFLDQKRSLLPNPVVEFIRAAVDMVLRGFTYDSVFRLLRSGLAGFTPEETDQMENYCLAVGVRGWKQYTARWVRLPKYLKPEEIEPLNVLRQRFVEQFEAFTEGMRMRNGTMRHRTEVLYRLLEAQQIQQKAAAMEQRFTDSGEYAAAREYAQIYPLVITLLDRMVESLGPEKMSMTAFSQILEAGLAELRVGLVPPGEDQVMIGDIERTRLKHIRVLFFAGVNEGIVPRASAGDGILSASDRTVLEQQKIELAPKGRTLMYRQRFYLYLAMTKPRDRLYLSCSETGLDGSSLMPSYLIAVIRKMYPALRAETYAEVSAPGKFETPEGIRNACIEGIRMAGPDDREVSWLDEKRFRTLLSAVTRFPALAGLDGTGAEHSTDHRDAAPALEAVSYPGAIPEAEQTAGTQFLLHLLAAAGMHRPEEGITPGTARALYGAALVNSATRLERYAACAFSQFARYGLRLDEREEYEFTPADMGTILHGALELFAKDLQAQHLNWAELPDQVREEMADRALYQLTGDYGNTILQSTVRSQYQITRIRHILQRTVWALQEQLRRSSFVPADAEAGFQMADQPTMQINLSGDTKLRLRGKIDRIDLCEQDGKKYVRIIDYKTGTTSLDLAELYYGLQIQLPLYMNAAQEMSGAEPAGIYYYNISDPLIEADADDPDAVRKAFLKQLRMDGISRNEDDILKLLDATTAAPGTAEVIHVSRKKDGTLDSRSHVAAAAQFSDIQEFTTGKIRAIGEQIMAGGTKVSPYLLGTKKACEWCPYRPVCGFDERIPGYRFRRLKTMTADEALAKMAEEVPGKMSDEVSGKMSDEVPGK
ncbi:MAG: PD-(D/E)XK nuclease family protein [Eubacterium sp.]|nr:PD-(D/E)XK nuclease family protein [Eubacterium sp.]